VREAAFSMSVFGATEFDNLDLSIAKLFHTRHIFASTISIDTLRRSSGRIPEAFLRGCGFSNTEILTAKLWDPDLAADELTNLLHRIHAHKTTAAIQKR